MIWVPDHLDDVEADFRAFYGLTPEQIVTMTGPHFLALVWRLGAYQGVVAARMREESAPRATGGIKGADTVVESTPAALAADPAFAGLFTFGTG